MLQIAAEKSLTWLPRILPSVNQTSISVVSQLSRDVLGERLVQLVSEEGLRSGKVQSN